MSRDSPSLGIQFPRLHFVTPWRHGVFFCLSQGVGRRFPRRQGSQLSNSSALSCAKGKGVFTGGLVVQRLFGGRCALPRWIRRGPPHQAARLRGFRRAATTDLGEGGGTQDRSGGIHPLGFDPEGMLRDRDANRSRSVSEHHADDRRYRGGGEKGAEETSRRAGESSASSLTRVYWSRRMPLVGCPNARSAPS